MARDSIIYEKSRRFASRIVRLHSHLQKKKDEHVISAQIVRSGTSVGANVAEALYAASRRDFLNKLTIALKECSETIFWLDVLRDTEYIEGDGATSLTEECRELIRMLIATVSKLKEPTNTAYEVKESVAEYDFDFENPLFKEGGLP
jgi:four helix bundle protein